MVCTCIPHTSYCLYGIINKLHHTLEYITSCNKQFMYTQLATYGWLAIYVIMYVVGMCML